MKKIPIYQKHIAYCIAKPTFGIILIMTGLVWLSQTIKLIYLFDKGIAFYDFCYLVILVLPSLFFAILPFGVVVGTLIGYNELSHDRELVVLSNSGLTPYDLIKPALALALGITLVGYFISLYLLPLSYSKLKTTLNDFRDNYVSNLIQPRVFTPISKNVTLYVSGKDTNGVLQGVILFERQHGDEMSVLFAKTGRIYIKDHEPYYELRDGTRQLVDKNGRISQMSFDNLLVALKTPQSCSDAEKDQVGKCQRIVNYGAKNLQEYFLSELFDPEYDLGEIKKVKLRAEGHQRIVWPLYSLVVTCLTLAIFMQNPYSRRGNTVVLVKAAVAAVIVIVIHFGLQNAASKIEIINLALYANVVLCLGISYYLLNYRENKI